MTLSARVRQKVSTNVLESLQRNLTKRIQEFRAHGMYKSERIITSPQSSRIIVESLKKERVNFCSNNYLGLSNHPRVIAASKTSLDNYGFGLSSVRFICGTQDIHKELEHEIAKFHNMDDAILYASCFDANAGFFESLFDSNAHIFSDELNHASIIDGIRLCKAKKHVYKHKDLCDLKEQLIGAACGRLDDEEMAKEVVIATDGVFSMDGNVAEIDKLLEIATNFDALLFIDECHATGCFGPTGKGTLEYFSLHESPWLERVVINSTLGKALGRQNLFYVYAFELVLGGAVGGYTAGPQWIIDSLRQFSRPYIFSNSLCPVVVGASLEVFKLINDPNTVQPLLQKLRENTDYLRTELKTLGFTVLGAKDHPIVPVLIGDEKQAQELSRRLYDNGIFVSAFAFPVVPKTKARIRFQISAIHNRNQLDHLLTCMKEYA